MVNYSEQHRFSLKHPLKRSKNTRLNSAEEAPYISAINGDGLRRKLLNVFNSHHFIFKFTARSMNNDHIALFFSN